MQRLILLALSILCLNSLNSHAGQASVPQTARANDHVTVQRRRIVLVRSPELATPERRTAVVIYPVVSGLSDPVVLRRVRSAFDFKNIFDYSLKEYREDTWLSEFSYVVNYNKNYLLDITFTQSGVGAYPDEHTKHFLINLKDGSVVKASDVFEFAKLRELAAAVNRKLQEELEKIEKENTDAGEPPEDKAIRREANEVIKFEVQNLDEFSVSARGITFLYDAGFPHAIKAFEPVGRYFFSYSQLKTYIKRDGPLGQFIR